MQTCTEKDCTYAGFWVRLAAFALDSAILAVGLLAVRLALAGPFALLEQTPLGGQVLFDHTLQDILFWLLAALYNILLVWRCGATPGKRVMNLRVVARDGSDPGLFSLVYRETVADKDRVDPVNPAETVHLDQELLHAFPVEYCHLAYLQTKIGYNVNKDCPRLSGGPAMEALYKKAEDWLSGK